MSEGCLGFAETRAGHECRLWDFLASDYWRCLCGRAYRRGTDERVSEMDDMTGWGAHIDGKVWTPEVEAQARAEHWADEVEQIIDRHPTPTEPLDNDGSVDHDT